MWVQVCEERPILFGEGDRLGQSGALTRRTPPSRVMSSEVFETLGPFGAHVEELQF
jgi:hypothetical protein